MLRWLLHPEQTLETQTLAHLLEIGAPVRAVLDVSAGEASLGPMRRKLQSYLGDERRDAELFFSADATPRERMLARLVHDELTSQHPYDPTGTFGVARGKCS